MGGIRGNRGGQGWRGGRGGNGQNNPAVDQVINALRGAAGGPKGHNHQKNQRNHNNHHTKGGLEQISITGWKQSKAASNPGGCQKQLAEFLVKKATPFNTSANNDVRIIKVCLKPQSVGHKRFSNSVLIGPLSFQANLSERRPRHPEAVAIARG